MLLHVLHQASHEFQRTRDKTKMRTKTLLATKYRNIDQLPSKKKRKKAEEGV